MIALWMLYTALVAALAGAAASAAERALRLAGRPARFVWLAAMAVSFALPLASLLAPSSPAAGEMAVAAGPSSALPSISMLERMTAALGWLDRPLLLAWLAATAGTLGFLFLSAWTLRRFRRGLPAAEVEGVPVRLSRDAGPAVLGFVRGEIVLPAWVLAREERLCRLMLAHEREHLRAGDPRLLLAGLMAVAAAPWSPALWWQFHRLKEAMEMDCDARVLRGGVDVRAYAELLIEVGRRARPAPLAVAAFSSPATRIEKRIAAMTFRPS
ncbi:MAG TPA: M56 family metallopeptidase, partial [Longimicrobium sp.]|nr:M56 family metallopeptidase [Longimicrobium sp.]